MIVNVFPTSFLSKKGERAALVIVKSEYSYPLYFEANGEEYIATPGFSRHLITTNGDLILKFENGEKFEFNIKFGNIKYFNVYVAPTFHTDIGYTDIQYNVEKIYKENFEKIINMAKNNIKFNIEVLWQVPEINKIKEFNEKGIIGVQAFPLNILTGLCSHEEIIRLFYPVRDLRNKGFNISVAALNDVPSAVWSIPTVLKGCGIDYFILASNPDRGPLHQLGDFISPLYWVGPDGSIILSWFSGGYKGLIPGFHGYHQGYSAGLLNDLRSAEAGIAHFLHYLETRGYPYEDVLLYGMFIDNARVTDKFAKIIDEFNKKWENPRLILSTTDEFFEKIKKGNYPAIVGDLGTYWEDGAASTARELAISRRAKKLLFFAEEYFTLNYLRGSEYPANDLNEVWKNIIYFDEHTWGDWASVSDPFSIRQKEEWRIKSSYAISAYNKVSEMVYGNYVSNPYPFHVRGIINYTYYELKPMSSRPLAFKNLERGSKEDVIETDFYLVKTKYGKIESVIDKDIGKEIANGFDNYVMLIGGKGTKLERTILNFYYEGEVTDPVFTVYNEYGSEVKGVWENDDVIVLRLESKSYLSRIEKEIVLPKRLKQIIVRNIVEKAEIYDKEGVYFEFPFNLKNATIYAETPGVFIDIAREQVRGACSNWFTINNILLFKGDFDVALYSEDSPLFTIDDVFKGDWKSIITPKTGRIYAYVMNNYWHTNYKASQGGRFEFEYVITSGKISSPSEAYRLLSRPIPNVRDINGDLIIEPPDVILTAFKKWDLGDGVIIRLLEPDNVDKSVTIKSNSLKGYDVYLANLLEEPKEHLGRFDGEIKIRVNKRGYTTLLFKK